MKLTLVSIRYRGTRHSFFVMAENGKISEAQLTELKNRVGVIPNTTYSIGS